MSQRSIVPISDNDCTGVSPCKNCHWHIQKVDKNRCVKICQKLKSYRDGQPYNLLPWPSLNDLQKDVDDNYDEGPGICEICQRTGKDRPAVIRGLCRSHYSAWQVGRVDHPRFGPYKRKIKSAKLAMQQQITDDTISSEIGQQGVKSTDWTHKREKVKVTMPEVKKVSERQIDEEVDLIVDNIAKKIDKKQKPVAKKKVRSKPLRLYLLQYPKIKQYLAETSEATGLPINHIVIALLSEGILARQAK